MADNLGKSNRWHASRRRDQPIGPAGPERSRAVLFQGLVWRVIAAAMEPGRRKLVGSWHGRGGTGLRTPWPAPHILHDEKATPHYDFQLLTSAELDALAKRAIYTGSVEHKEHRSWLGLPRPRRNPHADPEDQRQNATICPLVRDEERERATHWVQTAIRKSQFDPTIWDGDFPRSIWHRDDNGQYWHGRLTKAGGADAPAEYKGWPIDQDEWHANFS